LIDILQKKGSEILSLIEKGVREGWLENEGQGFFSFKDKKVQENFGHILNIAQREDLHKSIAQYFLQELPLSDDNVLMASYHLRHTSCDSEMHKVFIGRWTTFSLNNSESKRL